MIEVELRSEEYELVRVLQLPASNAAAQVIVEHFTAYVLHAGADECDLAVYVARPTYVVLP